MMLIPSLVSALHAHEVPMTIRLDETKPGDLAGGTTVKITREIPLWGIISVLGAFAAQAVGLYYNNVGMAKSLEQQGLQLGAMAADMRGLNAEINRNNVRNAEVGFMVDDLKRRITMLESRSSRNSP